MLRKKAVESPLRDPLLLKAPLRKRASFQKLFIGLLLTVLLSLYVQWTVIREHQTRFENAVHDIQTRIRTGLEHYENAILQARGLFVADAQVSRKEFHDYVSSLDFRGRYPGVQGLGFALQISGEKLKSHIKQVRTSGFPHYRVWPDDLRDEYFSVVYLEPFDHKNQRAFGYDMFTDPRRRAAMIRARDTGQSAITEKITLVQETSVDFQPGFLIYAPVYESNLPITTVQQRRQALRGFVYSPFRTGDFFKAIFPQSANETQIDFEVFDGSDPSQETLLYNHDRIFDFGKKHGFLGLWLVKQIPVDNRVWTIYFRTLPNFSEFYARFASLAIALSGFLLSFLLFRISENTRRHVETEASSFKELSNTQRRLELATLTSGVGIWEWEILTHRVTYEGIQWKLFGFDRPIHHLQHSDLVEKIHPDDRERFVSSLQKAVRENTTWEEEFRVIWFDGSLHWLIGKAHPFYDSQGRPFRMLGVNLDITERKNAEWELQQTKEFSESIANTAKALIIGLDVKSKLIFFNNTCEQVTGWQRGQVLGKNWIDTFVPERNRSEVSQTFRDLIEQIGGTHHENPILTQSGDERFIAWDNTVLKDNSGQISLVLGTGIDITDRKRAEELLKEAVRSRDEFISIASHELKTPITSMRMQIQMMNRTLKKNGIQAIPLERLERTFDTSMRQLDRLTKLVEDMLDISKMGKGKLTFEMKEHSLSQIVHEVIDRFSEESKANGSELHAQIESGIVGQFDSFRIEQVISNLISNAIKYGAGKPVEIALHRKTLSTAELRIRDFGIGIPKEAQLRIFERFERAISVKNISGLGLGLYIAQNILSAHHGVIRVESALGNGSIFTVELPLTQLSSEIERNPSAAAS